MVQAEASGTSVAMISRIVWAGFVPAALLMACSQGQQSRQLRAVCEEAVAQAAAPGRASARLFALASVKYQVQEVRGFLLRDGYHGVREEKPAVVCGPYGLGLGLSRCIATVRLCSR
jgi:hypothetical protein